MAQLFSEKNLKKARTINDLENTSKNTSSEVKNIKKEEKTENEIKENAKKTQEIKIEEKQTSKKEENKELKVEKTKEKSEIKTKKTISSDNRLIFGFNEKKKPLFIPESSRYLNTLVLGLKGTGKTTGLLPFFVEQDLKNKQVGATIFVTKQEMAYTIYTLAKQYKRKIIFIKPSIDNQISNKFLYKTEYDYDYIDTEIICYKEAIKSKSIVIVDMELLKYKSEAIKVCAMLLLQLQLDIQETDLTSKIPHFLYLDDAEVYLPFIKYLLQFSDNYNLGITLFMNSRNQMGEYKSLIDNYIRNIFLLNAITIEDNEFYKLKFKEQSENSRTSLNVLYEVIDGMNNSRIGIANYKRFQPEEWEDLEKKSKKYRTKLLKEKRTKQELELRDDLKGVMGTKSVKGEPIPIDESILKEDDIIDFTSETEEEIAKKEEAMHEEIRTQIIEEEKSQKRELATKSFNNMNKKIDYCDDNFDFEF